MPEGISSRWTVIPQRRSSDSSATKRAWTIIMSAVTLIFLLLGLVVMLISGMFSKETDLSTVTPQGRGVADAVAEQTISTGKIQVPTAQTLDETALQVPLSEKASRLLPYKIKSMQWVGFKKESFQGSETQTTDFEVHRYLLVPDMTDFLSKASEAREALQASGGVNPNAKDPANASKTDQEIILDQGVKPFVLEVPVLMTPEGPRQAGAASLAPWTESEAKKLGAADYSEYSNIREEVNTQTAKQIGKWAVAYASDDRQSLLEVTGDSDSSHTYEGLGGFKVPEGNSSVQALSAVEVNGGDLLVRVRVLLEDTLVTTGTETERPFTMYNDFDVLVSGYNDATPRVVAWGAAGSGASLEPGVNATKK